jgi:hypothetical protein
MMNLAIQFETTLAPAGRHISPQGLSLAGRGAITRGMKMTTMTRAYKYQFRPDI